uniref:Uncharacterized protein n=1 Tax=Anguilla anguilla TaxID=7936 RepID=A0A0E9WZ68_ANGAN
MALPFSGNVNSIVTVSSITPIKKEIFLVNITTFSAKKISVSLNKTQNN